MKVLLYFGHPAQYLFLRETMYRMLAKGHSVKILIKTKDVLEKLLSRDGFEYENILPQERGRSKISIIMSLVKRNLKLFPIIKGYNPDILIGTDASLAQMGRLLNINRITITEDDYDIIRNLGNLTYPFTQTILCPIVCDVGKWNNKKIGYSGYMKLGYLHPNVFTPDISVASSYQLSDKYVLVRLARLTAHHDFGVEGIDEILLDKIISKIEKKSYKVFISAEGNISNKYQRYLLRINPNDMHHILAHASFLICDSQSMSVEAAVLGVPSIRFSSFAGKISVLEELEKKYDLTFGVHPSKPEELLNILDNFLNERNLIVLFKQRREAMLNQKIDVSTFLVWFIENYPESAKIMKENPDYQHKFK